MHPGGTALWHGRRATFPVQLYALLEQTSPEIISWLDDGESFRIHDKVAFVEASRSALHGWTRAEACASLGALTRVLRPLYPADGAPGSL